MKLKGVVLKIKRNNMVVFLDNGKFVNVKKIEGVFVGQQIAFDESYILPKTGLVKQMSAVAAVFIVSVLAAFVYNQAFNANDNGFSFTNFIKNSPTPSNNNGKISIVLEPSITDTVQNEQRTVEHSATDTPAASTLPSITEIPAIPTDSEKSLKVSVDYKIRTDWGHGATVDVVVKNNGKQNIKGWVIKWTFDGDQKIYESWQCKYCQSGKEVEVRNEDYNAEIKANGGEITFGFNLNYCGKNSKPGIFFINGVKAD